MACAVLALALAQGQEAVVYKQVDQRGLKLFVDKPPAWQATDQRPAIVFFFGGGWVGGTPAQFLKQSESLARRGMVGIRVEYRTIPKGDHGPPVVCCADAKSAMRYVRGHAAELGIDPRRIAAAGGSAGGHLAAFTGLVDGLDDAHDDLAVSCKPDALVLFNPVFNNGPGQWGHERVGTRYQEFSPAHNIRKEAPPAIVFLGDSDKLIPLSVLQDFAAGMKHAGARCDTRVYPNAGHGFFNREPHFALTLAETDTFLTSLGWLQPPQPTARAAVPPPAGAAKPNIIFILADDLGWTDLGCFGSKFYTTPNIDRLAGQGMRFTDAYSACTVCSPSRAAILTGQYPARLHLTDWIAGHVRPQAPLRVPDWTMHLPLEAMNLAKALQPAGYASASIGKWHLGEQQFWPDRQGFDLNVAGCQMGQPPGYFPPYRIPTLTDGPAGEFLSDRLTTEAVRFIQQNRQRPFFLYLPHYAVHTPLMAKPAVIDKYRQLADPAAAHHNPKYAALIESVDDSVGVILRTLDELQLADHTIVIFTSDNGGLLGNTSNVPLRAGKGSAYEGGVRVPLIVKWPAVTQPASVCHTPVIGTDFYPTLRALAGVPKSNEIVDGENLEPLLRQSGTLTRNAIYWHYPHYHPGGATPYGAIRQGDFRLVEFYQDHQVELYNLKEDPAETRDLAATRPDLAAALRQQLHAWRQQVGAQMPTPNPAHEPTAQAGRSN